MHQNMGAAELALIPTDSKTISLIRYKARIDVQPNPLHQEAERLMLEELKTDGYLKIATKRQLDEAKDFPLLAAYFYPDCKDVDRLTNLSIWLFGAYKF